MSPPADGLDESVTDSLEPGEIDDLFAALADSQRRVTIQYLAECDGMAPFDEVVEVVAMRTTDGDATRSDRNDVATSLHHVHLPKLDAAGLIEERGSSGVVRATDRVAELPASVVE